MNWFKKLLIFLGFTYCQKCGSKLYLAYKHGWHDTEVYKCTKCDPVGTGMYRELVEQHRNVRRK